MKTSRPENGEWIGVANAEPSLAFASVCTRKMQWRCFASVVERANSKPITATITVFMARLIKGLTAFATFACLPVDETHPGLGGPVFLFCRNRGPRTGPNQSRNPAQ